MRKLYFIVAASVIAIILLFTFTFLFFAREKHKGLIYTVWLAGKKAGYLAVHRYKTEGRIIYKSTEFRPKEAAYKIIHEKTIFSKKNFSLEKFIKEWESSGPVTKAVYIKDDGKAFSFLAKAGSRWAGVTNVAHAKDISVFNLMSVAAYMPILDKYDFIRGGAQSFSVLYLTGSLFPPARGRIIFKSIRDEYIDVEGKKTKTEVFVVKSKMLPEAYLWVSKKDRSILRLAVEEESLEVKKVAFHKKIEVSAFAPESTSYKSFDVLFPSGDIALAGTIAIPDKKGKLPAVLLITGEGPYTRENAGLYTDIAHELAENGFLVLRFDRRGIGKSQGDVASVSLTDEMNDIGNALKFMSNHEKADRARVFIIAHGEACSYLPRLDFSERPVKGVIMLAPSKPTALANPDSEQTLNCIKEMQKADREYAKTQDLSMKETLSLTKNTKKEYVFAYGKHLFARRMSQLFNFKPTEGFGKFDIPLLIIYGKKDEFGSQDYVNDVVAVLNEAKLQKARVIHFRKLGHFLGKLTDEGNMVKHYRINREAIETLKGWINEKLAEKLAEARGGRFDKPLSI